MEELISLYDNVLIYYPNVFLLVLFFLSILGIIKVRRVVEEAKRELNNKKKKSSFVSIARVFLIRINTLLARHEIQIKKIVKKVGKQVLIENK
ncbi:MAG: hypothetical protein HYV37_02290 [Candidatus Levyibacteriota bacterium]|nr:MAG: hypothetical protein HYV37_02290 [Candidatus Levybacteria bacterium]